jgi:threonine/homoserine/homoserine lactone efflux protein
MLTTTGLNFGVRRGIPHLLGICIGFPVMLALIGLGFGTLFQLYPVLHEIIRIIGIVYLLYLAAAFQWINPKAWIMGSSALAAYTTLDDNFFVQVTIICITFMIITFPCAGVWLVFGAGLQKFLRDPAHLKLFNIAMALLLVASILPVVWEMLV